MNPWLIAGLVVLGVPAVIVGFAVAWVVFGVRANLRGYPRRKR